MSLRTEEEIKQKKDSIIYLLQEGKKEIVIGGVSKGQLHAKLHILNWVLGEIEPIRPNKIRIDSRKFIADAVVGLLKQRKKKEFTSTELCSLLNLKLYNLNPVLRKLKKEGLVKYKQIGYAYIYSSK